MRNKPALRKSWINPWIQKTADFLQTLFSWFALGLFFLWLKQAACILCKGRVKYLFFMFQPEAESLTTGQLPPSSKTHLQHGLFTRLPSCGGMKVWKDLQTKELFLPAAIKVNLGLLSSATVCISHFAHSQLSTAHTADQVLQTA